MKTSSPQKNGERARFSGAQRVDAAEGKCRIRVKLDLPSGGSFVGESEGDAGVETELRTAAAAALEALRKVADAKKLRLVLELGDVEAFEAFGQSSVMVALNLEHQNQQLRLLGFSPLGDEAPRAVALAVLSATNRIMTLV